MSRFTDLLAAPQADRRFLAILEPYDPVTGAVVTVTLSSHGFTSGPADSPAGVYFAPRIQGGYQFKRALFGQGRLSGRSVPDQGTLSLINGDGGLDALGGYGWGGRRVRIFLGGPDFALGEYGQVFEGTAQGLAFGDGAVSVNLRSLAYLVDLEAQPTSFAGTGGSEGADTLTGRVKPDAFGPCSNVEPVYLGVSGGRHLFSVASGPIIDVTTVYDRGVPLTYAAANPAAGQWSVDLETGTITLGGAFQGPVTADVVGRRYRSATSTSPAYLDFFVSSTFIVADGTMFTPRQYVRIARTSDMHGTWMYAQVQGVTATTVSAVSVSYTGTKGTYSDWTISAEGTPAGILRHLAERIGVTRFDTAGLAAFEALQPNTINYWIPEGGNAAAILDAVADASGCFWGFDRAGRFTVGRIDPPLTTPALSFDETQILAIARAAIDEPSSFIKMHTTKNWRVFSTDQIAGAADARKTFLVNEWSDNNIYSPSLAAAYPLGRQLTIDTLYVYGGALGSEYLRLKDLYATRRDYFQVRVKLQTLSLALGATVRISHSRFGLAAGRTLVVVDLDEDLDAGETTLGLWG